MGRYIIRRLLQFIPVFFGATLLIFTLVFLIPGDPIRALAGERPLPENVQAELRDQYDLDDPFFVQYAKYMGFMQDDDTESYNGILQGNFGTNFRGRPVSDIMAQAFPLTLRLAVGAFLFEIVLGIIAGVLAGLRKGSFIDNLVRVSTITVISIPIFVIGYVAQLVLGVQLGWFPISYSPADGWFTYLLPAIVLGSLSLAYVARLTRTQLIENKRADFVRTARAKGLPNGRVTIRHTLRNSLIPVVTYLGIDFGTLLGGAIVTETIFNFPGIGRTAYDGVIQQEGTVVVGIITALVIIYVVANLLVDIAYAYLDPRIRYE
ncbi:ABC transporter permease [Euzebya sp.]|uniref:ABC transporter permease n=1 Tax=Euzebya sp. TaxID=1971409 RepID=UPI00351901BE